MRSLRCPICKRSASAKTPYAPFCSERCKLLDLSRWLSEDYRLPGEPAEVPEHLPGDDDDEHGG